MTLDLALKSPFASLMMAGYECSTHISPRHGRHDILRETLHDQQTLSDYRLLEPFGIRTVREGLRWNEVEPRAGQYQFSGVRPMIQAARTARTQVIWDLFHFGYPDNLSPFSGAFVERLEGLTRAFVKMLAEELPDPPLIAPINELSFLAWAAGEVGIFAPFAQGRGNELKRNLARAGIAASAATLEVAPHARLIHPDPAIHVVAPSHRPDLKPQAEFYRQAQFEGWDLISGRREPELGGREAYLDILGLNFYPYNQWEYGEGHKIRLDDVRFKPFSSIAKEVFERYQRPMIIAETGAESALRAPWLRYIAQEAIRAIQAGLPLWGLCLYPILNHPGWDDGRYVPCGLWGYRRRGERRIDEDYALEVMRFSQIFESLQHTQT